MPRIGVQHCLRDFGSSVSDALSLLNETENYRIIQTDGRTFRLGIRRKELFAAIALLRMHLAWEDYVENVFIRYLCGATTDTGYSPVLLVPRVLNTSVAMSNLLGNSQFLNWSPSSLSERA